VNKLQELKQELEDVNSYVKHYEKKEKKKKLKYWKNIQKYVYKKYAKQQILEGAMNS